MNLRLKYGILGMLVSGLSYGDEYLKCSDEKTGFEIGVYLVGASTQDVEDHLKLTFAFDSGLAIAYMDDGSILSGNFDIDAYPTRSRLSGAKRYSIGAHNFNADYDEYVNLRLSVTNLLDPETALGNGRFFVRGTRTDQTVPLNCKIDRKPTFKKEVFCLDPNHTNPRGICYP